MTIPLPYAGHPVTTFLGELGLLHPFLLAVLNGTFVPERARHEARIRRHTSTVYLTTLAEQQPATRPCTAIALSRRALAVHKDSPMALSSLGRRLARIGRLEEALPLLRRAVKVSGGAVAYRVHYAEGLAASGDIEGALRVAAKVIAKMPDRAYLRHWHAWMLAQAGRHADALVEQSRAAEMDPGNLDYRTAQRRYRKALERQALAATSSGRRPIVAVRFALASGLRTIRDAITRLLRRVQAR